MTSDFHQLVLLALLGTAIHWLFARSAIMKWFWDLRWWPSPVCPRCNGRYRKQQKDTKWKLVHACNGLQYTLLQEYGLPLIRDQLKDIVAALLACTACAGFWLGLGAGFLNVHPIDYNLGLEWLNTLGGSTLSGVVTVPILEGLLVWGLRTTRIE